MYNKSYAKLLEGNQLEYAPLNICIDDTWYCPATDTMLKGLGYKEIIDVPYPEDGKHYSFTWRETTKSIKKVWKELPKRKELTPKENRQFSYETELLCEYEGILYTVDDMNILWCKYSAEGSEKAVAIQNIISEAKSKIRERYPDN